MEFLEIADYIVTGFCFLTFPSFALGLIGFFILFAGKFGEVSWRYRKLGIFFLIGMAVVYILCFASSIWFQNAVRKDVVNFIEQNEGNITLVVNGDKIERSGPLLHDLKFLNSVTAHHSHPSERMVIELNTPKENRRILVDQDSQIENEFWVFDPRYRTTKGNEIGRIRSNSFASLFKGLN